MIANKRSGTYILVLIAMLISVFQLSAQEIIFYKVKTEVSKTSELLNDKNIDAVRLESLLKDLNTSINITKGSSKNNRNGTPVVINTDIQSLNELYKNKPAFNQVELIKISINSASDLNTVFDLDKLVSFYRLKYIYVEFAFNVCGNQNDECLDLKIKNLIKGIDFNVVVLYKLSIPN
jgi:hypothetical protein